MNGELQINHTYLLKHRMSRTLSEVKVLNITNTAILLRWKNGSDIWEEKEKIFNDYKIIEDISDFVHKDNDIITKYITANTKWIQCPTCNGSGSVPSKENTAGFITCPNCFGGKMIISVSEIND